MILKFKKNIANICSLLNATCGLTVILCLLFYKNEHSIKIACILILIGAFFDSIDGLLARSLNSVSLLGKELDSFADIITFGIAPICIFLSIHKFDASSNLNIIQIFIGLFYIICAIYRLARFNVAPYSDAFEGLPTTASGMILSLYTMLSFKFFKHIDIDCLICFSDVLIVILALLMISKIKVPKPNVKKNEK